jgi:hypothetical protein
VQVKAQGLLNAAKFIEEEYGREALGGVLRACSEPVRERYVSAIAINWHPMEEFVEFTETADQLLGSGNGRLAEAIGAAGARAHTKGVAVRIASYIAQPEFLFRRVAGLWRQFNDEGSMVVHHVDPHSGSIEVAGLRAPNAIFCGILTGWVREISTTFGINAPSVRHTECRARGDQRCWWEIRWSSIRESMPPPGRSKSNAPASSRVSENLAQAREAASSAKLRAASVRPTGSKPPPSSRGKIPPSDKKP